jgi:translation initiation factor 2B subunit (eIF-2B alpha/beta/delta family)
MLSFAQNLESYLRIETEELDLFGRLFSRRLGGTLVSLIFAARLLEKKTKSPHYPQLHDIVRELSQKVAKGIPVKNSPAALARRIKRFEKRGWDLISDWMQPEDIEQNTMEWISNWDEAVSKLRSADSRYVPNKR